MTREALNQRLVAFRRDVVTDSVIGRAGADVVSHLERGLVQLEAQLATDLGLPADLPTAPAAANPPRRVATGERSQPQKKE